MSKNMKNDSWGLALRIMVRISGWIAFPVLIAVFLGKWLDSSFGTEPWLFLACVAFSFLISMYGLAKEAIREFKKIEKDSEVEKEKKSKESEK